MEKISVLRKCSTAAEAFSLMAGEYWIGEGVGGFAILDDDTFGKYILANAVDIIYTHLVEKLSKEELMLRLATDVKGVVSDALLGYPFILFSAKLGGYYYCYHYDPELNTVPDRKYEEAYTELIGSFDYQGIVCEALKIMADSIEDIRSNGAEAIIRIYENHLGPQFYRRNA